MMLAQLPEAILNVLKEDRLFPPSQEITSQARIGSLAEYQRLWNEAATDPAAFWGKLAAELHWFRPFTDVLQWREPFVEWFSGGRTNVAYNCLDIHLVGPRRNKAAFPISQTQALQRLDQPAPRMRRSIGRQSP